MFKSVFKAVALCTPVYVILFIFIGMVAQIFIADTTTAIMVPGQILTLVYMFVLPMVAYRFGYQAARKEFSESKPTSQPVNMHPRMAA